MSFNFYQIVHLVGLFMLLLSLGGAFLHALNGGSKQTNNRKKLVAINHGLGLFLVLLGGFGMLARLGITDGFPGWIWVKLIIWVLLGGALAVAYRRPAWVSSTWYVVILLSTLASIMAVYKPF